MKKQVNEANNLYARCKRKAPLSYCAAKIGVSLRLQPREHRYLGVFWINMRYRYMNKILCPTIGRASFRLCGLLSVVVLAACQTPPTSYHQAAVEAGAWLTEQRLDTDEPALIWPADVLAEPAPNHTLSAGTSGILLFYSALYAETGDEAYRPLLEAGGDALLASMPDTLRVGGFPPGGSLYDGWSGTAFALHRIYEQTGADRFNDGARMLMERVMAEAVRDSAGLYWSATFNDVLFGTAGTGLTLLYAHEHMQMTGALAMAEEAAATLQARAFADQGGLNWRYRQDREFVLPNFSHGAAGVGYFFARLYEVTGNASYLETAFGAARYLEAIAVQEGGGFRVPYGWPLESWEGRFDVGWAHGPAGTARLFYQLWRVTDDVHWFARTEQCAVGILQSGVPGTPNPGFGEEPFKNDLRFGIGGVAAFFIDLYRVTEKPQYREKAIELVDGLMNASAKTDAGRFWPMQRYSFMANGGEEAAFTGYFYGAAGYGLVLLHLDAAMRDLEKPVVLPDDPFVWAR